MIEQSRFAEKRKSINAHDYSFGLEEEFFITKRSSRETCQKMPKCLEEICANPALEEFQRELLQSQIEASTPPLTAMGEARNRLTAYRATLDEIAGARGYGIVAAGTHPKALRARQRNAEGVRYRLLMRDLQILGQRNMVCGLHVHVMVANLDARVSIMTRITPYLPLLLALSTSSPFWEGRPTGLMGYRLASYDELPRTGLPDTFANPAEYDRYIQTMVAAKAIKDASYVWWAVRPSLRHPTLELRVADACTRVDHSIAIAALYRALGGGWQIREGRGFVDASTAAQMRARTNWGDILPPSGEPQPPAPGLPGPEDRGPTGRAPDW